MCRDQRFTTNGEGRNQDYWLANSDLRWVIRHPSASLTLPGVGGSTLVDGAPWGQADLFHEIVPLVGGAALSPRSFTLAPDGAVMTGALVALPGEHHPREGEETALRWRLEPSGGWTRAEGSDGFWIHPRVPLTAMDNWYFGENVALGPGLGSFDDRGGVLVLNDSDRFWMGTAADALAARDTETQQVDWTVDGATRATIFAGETILGAMPIGERFIGSIPLRATHVRFDGGGRSSARVRVTVGAVTLAPTGYVDVQPVWGEATPRPIHVVIARGDGPIDEVLVPPEGATLAIGTGKATLTARAGVDRRPRVLIAEGTPGETQSLPLDLTAGFLTDSWIATATDYPMSRDASVRGTDVERARSAVADGLRYIVGTALHDVAGTAIYLNDAQWLRSTRGAAVRSSEGWYLQSRPWSANANRAGHGVPDIRGLSPEDAAAAMRAGEAGDRRLAVDLAWLRSLDRSVALVQDRPEEVYLTPPGPPPFTAWQPWFDALDRGVVLLPTGPITWMGITDAEIFGQFDIDRALERGRMVASTGPLLRIRIDGLGPGRTLEQLPDPLTLTVNVDLRAHPDTLDGVALVGSGGAILATVLPSPEGTIDETLTVSVGNATWITAVGWSLSGQHWAAPAPIWLGPPVGTVPKDTAPPRDTAQKVQP